MIYSGFTDEELMSFARNDDQLAFAEIYSRYKLPLYMHAYKKLADRDEAMDLIQEVFATLWIKRKTIIITSNLSSYLYTAIRNAVLNIFSHKLVKSKYVTSMEKYYHNNYTVTDGSIREKQLSEIIEHEIDALPAKMKQVFLMSRKQNLSHNEIATELNISVKTVDRQISNALKILKTRIVLIICLLAIVSL